jgi:imidazolonepropionase-like amidohydrolase
MPGPEQTRAEMPLELMRAAFDVAHAWGRHATCPVMGTVAIGRAIEAGVDIVEHGVYLDEALATRMAERGVVLDPTLSAYMSQTMHPRFGRGDAWRRAHEQLVDAQRSAFAAALACGVDVVVGTDSCGCYAEEVALMRAFGMSPTAALLACTATAARALGLEDEIGTVAPGRCADLVVLAGDPLADPRALESVEYVIRAGAVHRPADLALLEAPGAPGDVLTLSRMP